MERGLGGTIAAVADCFVLNIAHEQRRKRETVRIVNLIIGLLEFGGQYPLLHFENRGAGARQLSSACLTTSAMAVSASSAK
jgi:hypothetical protein